MRHSLLMVSLLLAMAAPACADSRPYMDRWVTGEEPNRMAKDLEWAQAIAPFVSQALTTPGGIGGTCFPDKNICFERVTGIYKGQNMSLVTYTFGHKGPMIGRKVCMQEVNADQKSRFCYNFYTQVNWYEAKQEDGSWAMIGDPKPPPPGLSPSPPATMAPTLPK